MTSSHQSPFGRSRQHPRISSPLFSTQDDNTTSSSVLSSKSSTISGGAEGSVAGSSTNVKNTPTVATAAANHNCSIEDKLQKDINNRALSKRAQLENDAMVYLDGPQIYTCGQCRTHLTSHDDIISKSFHGRHGRAYLFDQCVNIVTGPPEDRILITGLHSVCDINCKRCDTLVGWTYAKAYEPSQKYKEGKFIIEKINLHLEESDYYDVDRPAGERGDKWRKRSISWGSERSLSVGSYGDAYSRSCGGSVGGSASYSSSHNCPQTPPQRRGNRHHGAPNAPPLSPRSPSQIIYEYRSGD